MKVFLDTNVLVAACIEEHEHHARAVPVVEAVHQGQADGYVSAHSILETYAILTRVPRAPRITPAQAARLVEQNFGRHFTIVALTAKEYGELTQKLGEEGIIGGQAYDALHLECAVKSGAERIYTFNIRHFEQLGRHVAAAICAP